MMLALALAQTVPPAPQDDVVVIGERLKRWTGRVTTTIGITTCRTTQSTGDREIDAIGCTALRQCWSQYRPRLEAARDSKEPVEVRRQMMDTAKADLGHCLVATRDPLVAALADRRAARRAGS